MGVTSVRLQPEIEEGLDAVAAKRQRSRNWLINEALREYIEREALAESRWRETLAAVDSVKAGRVLPEEEVHDWLRSWGTGEEKDLPKASG